MTRRLLAAMGLVVMGAGSAAARPDLALVEAAKRHDTGAVQRLLRARSADANEAGLDGTTALHWAVQHDDAEMVAALIRAGADVRRANRYGVQPAWIAALSSGDAVMRLLLDAGADANTRMPGGETALMTAARGGKPETVKLLIAHGADVNARDDRGQTALMWAAAQNNVPAIRTLVEGGADLRVRTNNLAPGRERRMSVFNSPEPTGFSAFTFAVRAGALQAVDALLDSGADVNETVSDGQSALVIAAANAHWDVTSRLLDRGANPNLAAAGWNALHQAVRSRRPNLGYTPGPVPTGTTDSLDVIRKMIARGIDVNARMTKNGMKDGQRNRLNRLGATALLLAAKNTDLEVVRALADAGADPKMPTADGTTPLMVAAGLAIWYVGEDGGSLRGQEGEVFEVVKLLVELGNDVNAANLAGETPLHGAAFRGVNPVIEYLVERGARLDARDTRGWTPLTIATGISYGDVFKQQPQSAELLARLMQARGLSTEGQVADGTECLDCVQTHADQAQASLERDRRMEAEFNKTLP